MNRGQKRKSIKQRINNKISSAQTQNSIIRTVEMELTPEGWMFCIGAGLLEMFTALAICGIDFTYVPLLVALVLWAGFGIITSTCILGIGYCHICHRNIKMRISTGAPQVTSSSAEQKESWVMRKAS